MLAEYQEKKKNMKEEQPTYRPALTKYEDYKKLQKSISSKDIKPNGLDEDIERHKRAYQCFLHLQKIKDGEVCYMLECRRKAQIKRKQSISPQKKVHTQSNDQNTHSPTERNGDFLQTEKMESPASQEDSNSET